MRNFALLYYPVVLGGHGGWGVYRLLLMKNIALH